MNGVPLVNFVYFRSMLALVAILLGCLSIPLNAIIESLVPAAFIVHNQRVPVFFIKKHERKKCHARVQEGKILE